MGFFRFLFRTFLGFITPVQISGRALFRVKLTDFGVDALKIPEGFLNELAEQAVATAQKVAKRTGRLQTHVVVQVEGQAGMVSEILKPREQRFFQDTAGPEFRSRIVPVLEKYGIQVPPP